jgi:hypothetical protein
MSEQVLTDLDEAYTHTPTHLDPSIPVVHAAITDFKASIFKKCTWKGDELIPHGTKNVQGRAVARASFIKKTVDRNVLSFIHNFPVPSSVPVLSVPFPVRA